MEKKQRNSNLELLRILSILFIIFHHYALYGMKGADTGNTINGYILDVSMVFVHIAVNSFVLISGYFMAKQKIGIRKLFRLLGEVWFYSIMILLLFLTVLEPETPVGISTIVKSFFPVGYGQYWFVTGFILLMIFSPFTNLLMERMSRKEHFILLLVMYAIWSVSSTLFSTVWGFCETTWMFVLYFTGGYLRLHYKTDNAEPVRYLRRAVIIVLAMTASIWALHYIGQSFGIKAVYENRTYFVRQNSVLALAAAVEFFLYFLTKKPVYSGAINLIASASFGVYLIHEHVLLRPYLWHSVCRTQDWASSPWMPVHALVCVLGIFAVCTLMDLLRSRSVEKLWLKLLDAVVEPVQTKVNNLIDRIP